MPTDRTPAVSVVVLNYNGARWIERCLASLKAQTINAEIEIIVADNVSSDGSEKTAEQFIKDWPNARFIQHGTNQGYAEGNNLAIANARGEYLFIFNNDAWLEPDCLEILLRTTREQGAGASMPLVMNFDDDTFQSLGAEGFDIFGLASTRKQFTATREIFMPDGCAWLVERKLYADLGGMDKEIFMYSDEYDFSFRLWIAGRKAIAVPAARMHHRGAANVNPKGDAQVVEFRTSDTKRFYANRNGLMVLLKSGQHLVLMMALLQAGMLVVEALAALLFVRRWSFVRKAYIHAFGDVWRLRHHIAAERQRIQSYRKHGDFWLLRFLRWRPNRLDEIQRTMKHGAPKVTSG